MVLNKRVGGIGFGSLPHHRLALLTARAQPALEQRAAAHAYNAQTTAPTLAVAHSADYALLGINTREELLAWEQRPLAVAMANNVRLACLASTTTSSNTR